MELKKLIMDFKNFFLIPPHLLTNFEIQKFMRMNQDLVVFFLEIVYLTK